MFRIRTTYLQANVPSVGKICISSFMLLQRVVICVVSCHCFYLLPLMPNLVLKFGSDHPYLLSLSKQECLFYIPRGSQLITHLFLMCVSLIDDDHCLLLNNYQSSKSVVCHQLEYQPTSAENNPLNWSDSSPYSWDHCNHDVQLVWVQRMCQKK